MGGGVSRDHLRLRDGQVAAGQRGLGAGQHRLCRRWPPDGLPHHRLQQPGEFFVIVFLCVIFFIYFSSPRWTRYWTWGWCSQVSQGSFGEFEFSKCIFCWECRSGGELNQCVAGTRIGQASECFVYWKDPSTSDTWGLNFTSPIDAKQFRECCVSWC